MSFFLSFVNPVINVVLAVVIALVTVVVLAGSAIQVTPTHLTDPHSGEIRDEVHRQVADLSKEKTQDDATQNDAEKTQQDTLGDDMESKIKDEMRELMMNHLVEFGAQTSVEGAVLLAKMVRRRGVRRFETKMGVKLTKAASAKFAKKMACKVATLPAKMALRAGLGPVGIAWDVLDLASLALDLVDPAGYNNWSPNSDINDMAASAQEQAATQAQNDSQNDYPALMGPWLVNNEIWTKVFMRVQDRLMTNAQMRMPQKAMDDYFERMIAKVREQHPDLDLNDPRFEELIADDDDDKIWEDLLQENYERLFCSSTPTCRDILLTKELNKEHVRAGTGYQFEAIGAIRLFGKPFSSKSEYGIALTKDAADKWNEDHKSVWKDRYDYFHGTETVTEEEQVPIPIAMHTDTVYAGPSRTLHFGSNITFAAYLGPVYSFCEKTRQIDVQKADPYAEGVRFDFSKGRCMGSNQWCTRMGMSWDQNLADGYGDCYLSGIAETCEEIMGRTVCRTMNKGHYDEDGSVNAIAMLR